MGEAVHKERLQQPLDVVERVAAAGQAGGGVGAKRVMMGEGVSSPTPTLGPAPKSQPRWLLFPPPPLALGMEDAPCPVGPPTALPGCGNPRNPLQGSPPTP